MARVGIVGVSGYGGGELLRLVAGHPSFELAYAAGEASTGQGLAERFPWLAGHDEGALVIQPFDPEKLPGIDLLFVSLPTGKSRDPLARVPKTVKVVDVGGDPKDAQQNYAFLDGQGCITGGETPSGGAITVSTTLAQCSVTFQGVTYANWDAFAAAHQTYTIASALPFVISDVATATAQIVSNVTETKS